MNKTLFSVLLALALIPSLLRADVGEVPAAQNSAGKFTGTITAIETERDSITVENNEHIVKMFSVTPEIKGGLQIGQTVTVAYVDSWNWPLKTTSVSGASQ